MTVVTKISYEKCKQKLTLIHSDDLLDSEIQAFQEQEKESPKTFTDIVPPGR